MRHLAFILLLFHCAPSFLYGDLVVRQIHSSTSVRTLANVDAVLAGNNVLSESTHFLDSINFAQNNSNDNFSGDFAFPGTISSNDDNFVLQVLGEFYLPAAAIWTFGVNSDDGTRLRINGIDIIVDDARHSARDSFGSINLDSGWHQIDLVYFEHRGRSSFEFFAAQGNFNSFSGINFQLVGDRTNGGLITRIPEPASFIILVGLGFIRPSRSIRS